MNELKKKNGLGIQVLVAIAVFCALAAGLWAFSGYSKRQAVKENQEAIKDISEIMDVLLKDELAKLEQSYNFVKEDISFGKKSQYDLCVAAREITTKLIGDKNPSDFTKAALSKWDAIRQKDCQSKDGGN